MIKISIGHKIFIGFFVLILLSSSFLFITLPTLTEINVLSSSVVPLSKEMGALQRYTEKAKDLESKLELYLTVRTEEAKEDVLESTKNLNQEVALIKRGENLPRLAEISDISLELTGATYSLLGLVDKLDSTYKINLQIIAVNKLFDKFQNAQETLQRERLASLQKNLKRQEEIITAILDRFFKIEISIVVFGLLASFFLTKFITKNLSKLRKATGQIAAGNFQSRIDISAKDEIGQLAASFNSMAEDLEKTTVSKEYVDNIIASIVETLIVIEPNLKINIVNNAACKLLGYKREELIGEHFKKIFSLKDSILSQEEFLDRLSQGRLINFETYYRRKNTKEIPVLLSVSAMINESGDISYIICVARDITERKIAEEKIKEIAEMKSKLTSMVSHELRTPMAAIKTGISIVLDGLAGQINEEQEDILDTARRNVDRLARLINDVLDFQKLEAGKMDFRMVDNNINEVISECHKAMISLAKKKDLKFELELSEELSDLKFDRDKIMQVLSNLVNNAIKFTDKGSITISSKQLPEGVLVSVIDTGHGINDEEKERVFSSFEQLRRPAGGKEAGSGLGLAISREIIQKHKGRIWVESKLNHGSTFYFILPLR